MSTINRFYFSKSYRVSLHWTLNEQSFSAFCQKGLVSMLSAFCFSRAFFLFHCRCVVIVRTLLAEKKYCEWQWRKPQHSSCRITLSHVYNLDRSHFLMSRHQLRQRMRNAQYFSTKNFQIWLKTDCLWQLKRADFAFTSTTKQVYVLPTSSSEPKSGQDSEKNKKHLVLETLSRQKSESPSSVHHLKESPSKVLM